MKEKIFNFFKMQKLKIQCLENIVLNELKKEKSKIKKIGLFLLIPFRCIKVLIGKEFIIPYVEVVLTTFCNLKCKGCSALMEYYKNENIDILTMPIDYTIENLCKLYKSIIKLNQNNINHLFKYVQTNSITVDDPVRYDYYVASVNLANEISAAAQFGSEVSNVDYLISMIDSLPTVDKITLDNETQINSLLNTYIQVVAYVIHISLVLCVYL